MRILFQNTRFPPPLFSGADRSVQLLADTCSTLGHDVSVVALGSGDSTVERHRVHIHRLDHPLISGATLPPSADDDGELRRLLSQVKTIVEEFRPDVAVTNMLQGFSPVLWQQLEAWGVPVVHVLRDYQLLCLQSTMFDGETRCETPCQACSQQSQLITRYQNHVSHVVAISQFILEQHRSLNWFQTTPASVLGNPMLLPRGTIDTNSGPIAFGFLGRDAPPKGLPTLLQAFAQVHKLHPEITLYVAGSEQPSEGAGVTYLGFVPPQELFARIDVLVVPSLWNEPFGRVVLEANSYGIPVLSSPRGGLSELVVESSTGWLCEPHPTSLAEAMIGLAADPEIPRALAPSCREHAKSFFASTITERFATILGSVCPT